MLTHPTGLFSEDYISSPRGAAPSNFYTHWTLAKAYQRTPQTLSGVPGKILRVNIWNWA